MKYYLTNENIDITLPEIDNVAELQKEHKNSFHLDDLRDEITETLLRKDKKKLIKTLKKTIQFEGKGSQEILEKNQNWVKNILNFKKNFLLKITS